MLEYIIVPPNDFIPDDGSLNKEYPIEDIHEPETILCDKQIQKISYMLSSIVGIFDTWIRSFFPPTYFTFTRIKTESSFSDFKSFMKTIYTKDKPFMIIDPRSPELVEDSIFAQNMHNKYNLLDPDNDTFGSKLLYSLPLIQSERCALSFRRTRYKFEFEIMIMEQTIIRQLDTYNKLLMDIRHNSKFMLPRNILQLIPIRYIQYIANAYNYDYKSDAFLQFINTISVYPIIRRLTATNRFTFFFSADINIQVEVPGYPSKDTPEMSAAIEWGARIQDSFIFTVDCPAEFLFTIPERKLVKMNKGVDADPNEIAYISPILADLDWPTTLGEYTLTNRVDVMFQVGDTPSINIRDLILIDHTEMRRIILQYIDSGRDISDLLITRTYPNGSYQDTATTLDNDYTLTIHQSIPDKLYTVNIYINFNLVNLINEGSNKEYIGDIVKY